MKLCVYGLGAIGSYLAGRLATAADVMGIARGRTLEAVRAHGIRIRSPDGEIVARVQTTDRPAEAGPQDVVIVTLKAHALPGAVADMVPLLKKDTVIVAAQNGLPWWHFHRFGGALEGTIVEAVDPGGRVWSTLGPERALGCVIYAAAEVLEPAVIRHFGVNRLALGEPDGSESPRLQALSKVFKRAGLGAALTGDIRGELWVKLAANASANPLSVLTGATIADMVRDEEARGVLAAVMAETGDVAEALGRPLALMPEQILAGMARAGGHKTSMLQDYENKRPLELGALTGAVRELATRTGVATPLTDLVHKLVALKAQLNTAVA